MMFKKYKSKRSGTTGILDKITTIGIFSCSIPFRSLNDTLNDTLNFIIANAKATQKDIANGIGKSEATVKRATVELQRRGRLERMNGKRDGHWVVK